MNGVFNQMNIYIKEMNMQSIEFSGSKKIGKDGNRIFEQKQNKMGAIVFSQKNKLL